MTGLTYPYTKYDRLLGDQLDLDLEFSPGVVPPSGTAGGAGRFKYWVDTSTTLPSLRQCVVPRATAGAYVAAEWITLGTIDAANHKFHFNADGIDITGGTGTLTVNNIAVSSGLSVGGDTNLTTLHVAGLTSLNNTGITGVLSVTGNIGAAGLAVSGNIGVGGSLAVTGGINSATLAVSGASTLHDLTVIGGLTITGGGFSLVGPIATTGVNAGFIFYDRTLDATHAWEWYANNDIAYLFRFGSVSFLSLSAATGATTLYALAVTTTSSLHDTSVVGGLTVSGDASIEGTVLVGGLTSSSITSDGSLTVSGDSGLHNTAITGTLSVSGAITGASSLAVTGAITGNSLSVSTATVGTLDGIVIQLRGRNFANTDVTLGLTGIFEPDGATAIGIYATGATGGPTAGENVYRANSHNFHNRDDTLGFAVFTSAGTANQSGSWIAISDDSVKENVAPYTAGLAEILQLEPVSFNYVVPDEAGAHWSPFADPVGTTTPTMHYGLMASQVQPVIPEMVHEATFADIPQGIPETPLLTIAPTHLVYVIVNACKEIWAQVQVNDAAIGNLNTGISAHTQQIQALDARIAVLEAP